MLNVCILIFFIKYDFVDWGQGPLIATKPLPSQTVIGDLPFDGRTVYRDNYTKKNANPFNLNRTGNSLK